jgi:hypothetical protein
MKAAILFVGLSLAVRAQTLGQLGPSSPPQTATGTAVISGVVIDGSTKEPVEDAMACRGRS